MRIEAQITFVLRGTTHTADIGEQLYIDPNNLEEEFSDQAGQFYWYADAYGWAEKDEKRAKYELDCVYAQIDREIRGNASAIGQKMTEKMIEGAVLTDPRYVQVQDVYLAAIDNKNVLWAACEAFRQRKDMLVSIGAQRRAEAAAGFGHT